MCYILLMFVMSCIWHVIPDTCSSWILSKNLYFSFHISKMIFSKLSHISPIPHSSPSLHHIHPSMLPFPPLTVIIEIHLSEDLICPLLRRGFIFWHLHHRWHHLVYGLIDGASEREKEGKGQGCVGWGREKKKDKFIHVSRDPLRRLSRELKPDWTEK